LRDIFTAVSLLIALVAIAFTWLQLRELRAGECDAAALLTVAATHPVQLVACTNMNALSLAGSVPNWTERRPLFRSA
jgi:hypothetical protein